MAHAYLYEVGPGKTYATGTLALAQMNTDWGTDDFDADVVMRVFTATYTDQWTVPTTLDPTAKYPLIIEAAPGNSPVINATGNTYGIFMNTGPCHIRIYGIEVYGATTGNIYCRARFTYLEDMYSHDGANTATYLLFTWNAVYTYNCRFIGDGVTYLRASLYAERTYFAGSGSAGNHGQIRLVSIGIASYAIFESCVFDDVNMGAGIDHITVDGDAPTLYIHPLVILRHPVFKGAETALGQLTAGQDAPGILRVINPIFVDQATTALDVDGYPNHDLDKMYRVEAADFWNCGNFLVDVNGTYTSLAQLQAAGYDTLSRSIDTDPDETGPFDGTIAADSPCIEAGIGSGVLLGLNGGSFNPYLPSIGADAQHDGADVYAQRSDWVGEITAATPIDFPARTSVLTTDTVNGLAGLWTKGDRTKMLVGNDFGVAGSEVATYSPDFPARASVLTTDTVNGLAGLWVKGDKTYMLVTHDFGVAGSEVAELTVDLPERENVLTTDTVGGLPGLWTKAVKSRYQRDYAFGINGISEDGGNRLVANAQVLAGVVHGPSDGETGTHVCPGAVAPSGDLLEVGGAWLADMALTHLAREIVYKRGSQTVSVSAATGRTDWDVEAESGVVERIESRDFFIRASDLVLSGSVVTPARGDIIKETISGTTHLYEVNAPAGEDVYTYGTHGKDILRIHTKHTGEE